MAIKVRPADTQSGPTLMGRILPDLINNKVGYGSLKKKNPKRVQVFVIPGPDPTRLNIKLSKTPYIYKLKKPYFLSYSTLNPNPFPTQLHSPLPLSLTDRGSPSSPSLTYSHSRTQPQALTTITHRRHHTISPSASSFVTVGLKFITSFFLSFFVFSELRSVFSKCSSAKICYLHQDLFFFFLGSLLGA